MIQLLLVLAMLPQPAGKPLTLKAKHGDINMALKAFNAPVNLEQCTTGYYDSDGYWVFGNGPCGAGGPGCVDCQWDVNNCGAVGHICRGIDGYQATCVQGQCEIEDPQGPGSILPSQRKPK